MTGAKHRFSEGTFPSGIFIAMGVLLSISLSVNAVFYVLLTWDLVPN
jgi:hypothetical protein